MFKTISSFFSSKEKMCDLPNWPQHSPEWDGKDLELLLEMNIQNSDDTRSNVEEIMRKSEDFPRQFPIESVKLKTVKNYKDITEEFLNRNINSVYPLVHERVLKLFTKFLDFKKNHGSKIEKDLYKDMNLKQFIQRLIQKRAVCFYGSGDRFLLLDGKSGSGGWEAVGTDHEESPLVLRDCLSYDEIKLNAFVYVSSYTYFLNKGDRRNRGVHVTSREEVEKEGIIIGMIGPRFETNKMDEQDIIINTKSKNSPSVQNLIKEFYEEEHTVPNNADSSRYVTIDNNKLFDNVIYHKRLAIAFDSLLLEANFRAKEAGKHCYLHVVGIGLGVWMISAHQTKVFLDSFYKRVLALHEKIEAISDICFSWFEDDNIGGVKDEGTIKLERHPLGGVKVHIFNRNPHEKLTDENQGKLIVASYAWDGNALPGNEFWNKSLTSSGDPAAACSTQITELHNPHINPVLCADNLRVVCEEDGNVVRIDEYQRRVRTKYGIQN